MFYLFNHLTRSLLVTAALGYCSIAAFASSAALLTNATDPDNGTEHRGSGRLYTQVLPALDPLAILAHRGSGRIDEDVATSDSTTAYRGSGRITSEEPVMLSKLV